jgi:hypothetical protein
MFIADGFGQIDFKYLLEIANVPPCKSLRRIEIYNFCDNEAGAVSGACVSEHITFSLPEPAEECPLWVKSGHYAQA